MRIQYFLVIYSFIFLFSLPCQDQMDQAIEAYRESDFPRALLLLEKAEQENPANDEIYNYRGLIYQKEKKLNEAEASFLKGQTLMGSHQYSIKLNLANLYFNMGKIEEAIDQYGQLFNTPKEAKARLNRANCYMRLESYPQAVQDYRTYLQLDPDSEQKDEIEKLISLLDAEIEHKQELARLEEEERLAAERAAAEEAARQQALLDEILASLENTESDTEAQRAESESFDTETEDSDIIE